MTSLEEVKEEGDNGTALEYLDFISNVFVHRDWEYTRDTNIKKIEYKKGFDDLNTVKFRIKMAFRSLTRSKKHGILYDTNLRQRIVMSFYHLKKDANLPDGHLDGGNVITFWEETGEYIQLVQPSVGSLLAKFLKEDPENPHAKIINAELDRIHEGHILRLGMRKKKWYSSDSSDKVIGNEQETLF
jgi:hypothetical protein